MADKCEKWDVDACAPCRECLPCVRSINKALRAELSQAKADLAKAREELGLSEAEKIGNTYTQGMVEAAEARANRYKAAFKRWIGFCRAERDRLNALLFDEKLDLRHRREDGLWTAGNLETQNQGEAFKDPRNAIDAYLKALTPEPAKEE